MLIQIGNFDDDEAINSIRFLISLLNQPNNKNIGGMGRRKLISYV